MKKVLCVLLAILAVFSLAAGIGYGLAWYQGTHVTIGGHSYYIHETELDLGERQLSIPEYEQLQAVLEGCDITWQVPFQGGRQSSKSTTLKITRLTEKDMSVLQTYFPYLTTLDATDCPDYALLQAYQDADPDCTVVYEVNLGGEKFATNEVELTLEEGDYTLEALMKNLQYIRSAQKVVLRKPDLSLEQIQTLKDAYPSIDIQCTVEILGQEYDSSTTQLDLSAVKAEELDQVTEKLAMLSKLEFVELMDAQGQSALELEDVKKLLEVAPNASFHYVFEFYGQELSSDMDNVNLIGLKLTDAAEAELRTVLDLMPKCERFVLDNCGLSNEVLAKLRDDYRGRTKIVWRISFGTKGSCLTDVEIFRCVGGLEKNYEQVKYCEDVVYMDVGHCDRLRTIEYVAYMPKLKAAIFSGSEISDLSPLEKCPELEYLELGFCGWVDDISPLKSCKNLKMLNIADTKVTDLSALDELELVHFVGLRSTGKSRINLEGQEAFRQKHPYCITKFDGNQPYGVGWRYEEDNLTFHPYYHMLRIVFRYDMYGKESQQMGYYLADVDPYLKDTLGESKTLADYQQSVDDYWVKWKKDAEEAARKAAEEAALQAQEGDEAAEETAAGDGGKKKKKPADQAAEATEAPTEPTETTVETTETEE